MKIVTFGAFFKYLVLGLLLSANAYGVSEDPLEIPSLATLRSMNGIDPKPYDKFWLKWPLVTVRFRSDNGEQRYIYANQKAYRAMKEGLTEFPDGSVFGKVAFATEDDPQFPNSMDSTTFTRIQLMVKNK